MKDVTRSNPKKRKSRWGGWSRDLEADITANDVGQMRKFVQRLRPILIAIGRGKLATRMRRCLDAHVMMREALAELAASKKLTTRRKEAIWTEAHAHRCKSIICPCCAGYTRERRKRNVLPKLWRDTHMLGDAERMNHVVFRVVGDADQRVEELAETAHAAFGRLVEKRRGIIGMPNFRGAFRVLHVAWDNGPRDQSVHDRSGWNVHQHTLVRVAFGAGEPDEKLLGKAWSEALDHVDGLDGRVKVVDGRGDVERRVGYFFKNEAKFMAGLCDADLEELVRFLLGAGKERAPKLSGLHGSLRRHPQKDERSASSQGRG